MPRSSKNEISGWDAEGNLMVRLTAPPVDGKANNALIRFLSDRLDLPQTSILILTGSHSRIKRIRIIGISTNDLGNKLGI